MNFIHTYIKLHNTNLGNIKFLLRPIFFIFSILAGVALVLWIERLKPTDVGYKDVYKKEVIIEKRKQYPLRKPAGSLTTEEMEYGRIAWKYFENNYQDSTGLVNSVDFFPAATFWDMGSYLMGMTSAYEIGIIDSMEFDRRLTKCLHSLASIKLYEQKMPNKLYNTRTLQMVDYENIATDRGIGWSALDIGRFYSFINKMLLQYPQYHTLIKKVINRWQLENMVEQGTLHGIVFTLEDEKPRKLQEGKLGYEQYSGKGLSLAGYDVSESLSYTGFLKFVDVYNTKIATDSREIKNFAAYNYITSEPYILDGLEYGWDVNSQELAYRVFEVQKERYKRTNTLTCVSEDHIDTLPSFVYNTVYVDGAQWKCIAENGDDASEFKSISTKAAFGWYALYKDEYAQLVFDAVKGLYDPDRGWYSGKYEQSNKPNKAITANTNGVVLEALNYKMNGRLIHQ